MRFAGENMEVKRSAFTITANDLTYPDDYVVNGRNMLRIGNSIVYNAARYAEARDNIFYGPYLTLPPSVYLFGFNGELDGELKIDFAAQEGRTVLRTHTIASFLDPLCLTVTQTLAKFEVRGFRTRSLNVLRLDYIAVEAIRGSDELVTIRDIREFHGHRFNNP
jgi:hypothetical protein